MKVPQAGLRLIGPRTGASGDIAAILAALQRLSDRDIRRIRTFVEALEAGQADER